MLVLQSHGTGTVAQPRPTGQDGWNGVDGWNRGTATAHGTLRRDIAVGGGDTFLTKLANICVFFSTFVNWKCGLSAQPIVTPRQQASRQPRDLQ